MRVKEEPETGKNPLQKLVSDRGLHGESCELCATEWSVGWKTNVTLSPFFAVRDCGLYLKSETVTVCWAFVTGMRLAARAKAHTIWEPRENIVTLDLRESRGGKQDKAGCSGVFLLTANGEDPTREPAAGHAVLYFEPRPSPRAQCALPRSSTNNLLGLMGI